MGVIVGKEVRVSEIDKFDHRFWVLKDADKKLPLQKETFFFPSVTEEVK
jgi:hypothetical protein